MKDLKSIIRNNWYKISILAILMATAGAVVYYFVFFLPKNVEKVFLQGEIAKCQEAGQRLYKASYDVVTEKMATSQEFRFVEKSNKCYLIVSLAPLALVTDIKTYETVVDVYNNTVVLASIWFEGNEPDSLGARLVENQTGSKTYEEAKIKLLSN